MVMDGNKLLLGMVFFSNVLEIRFKFALYWAGKLAAGNSDTGDMTPVNVLARTTAAVIGLTMTTLHH